MGGTGRTKRRDAREVGIDDSAVTKGSDNRPQGSEKKMRPRVSFATTPACWDSSEHLRAHRGQGSAALPLVPPWLSLASSQVSKSDTVVFAGRMCEVRRTLGRHTPVAQALR